MTFTTLQASTLTQALTALKPLYGTRSGRYMPVLDFARWGGTILTGTDLTSVLHCRTPVAPQSPVLLPVLATLAALKGVSRDAPVTLDVTTTPGHDVPTLTLSTPDGSTSLPGWPLADWPDLSTFTPPDAPADPFPSVRVMFAAHLRDAIRAAFVSVSTEETRYYLNGVYLEALPGDALRLAATDGHRLTIADIGEAPMTSPGAGLILPRSAIPALLAALPANLNPVTVTLTTGEAPRIAISPEDGSWSLRVKPIDGTFPDFTRVLPSPSRATMTFPAKPMAVAARAVALLGSGKYDRMVAMHPADGTVSRHDPDASRAVPGMVAPPGHVLPDAFGVNGSYLADALLAPGLGATARLDMSDPGNPLRITPVVPPLWGDLLTILMPMRLPEAPRPTLD